MSRFWNDRTRSLTPYVPGEQPKADNGVRMVKLNTNESPYPPSPKAIAAMQGAVSERLRLYPDPDCSELKQVIADYYGLDASNVFIGNGSDEVLAHVFAGLFEPSKPLVCPDISYSFYPVYAQLYGLTPRCIPLNNHLEIDLAEYPADNGGVIFANPNAPTSIALASGEIEAFLQRNQDSVVVVDEAYVDFGAQSVVPLISRFPQLLVVQTVSKSRSLAGMRVGFALGDAELIAGLERVKNSFNSYPLDQVAQAGAIAAFKDSAWFKQTTQDVITTRECTTASLKALGFDVADSSANFVWARPTMIAADALYLALKQQGILVRHFDAPRIADYLRISIGTDAEMNTLIAAIQRIVESAEG